MTESDVLCMFTAQISESDADDDETYWIELPPSEVNLGTLSPGDTVRVAVSSPSENTNQSKTNSNAHRNGSDTRSQNLTPPVESGDTRTVTIDHLGDQGDGIAKVDGGFVLIVPDTSVGEEVDVLIDDVNENFAIAERVDKSDNNSVTEQR